MSRGSRRGCSRQLPFALSLAFFVAVVGFVALQARAEQPTGSSPSLAALAAGQVVEPEARPGAIDRVPERFQSLTRTFLGVQLWQYVAIVIFSLLAFLSSRVIDTLILNRLRRLALRSATKVDDVVLELARRPVKIVFFVALLHLGLKAMSWPEWAAGFLSALLKGAVGATFAFVALRLVDVGLEVWHLRAGSASGENVGAQLLPVVRKGLKIFVVTVASIVTLQNVGMDVTGLLASLSIGGLALGLAAQDTLANLFGAVALFADKPFRVGDRIQLDGIDGTVETIGLRSTRIRNLDGFLVTVPNRTMANASLTNVSHRPSIKTEMNIGVTYDTPAEKVERAMEIIDGVYRPHPRTVDLIVSFNKFEASSLNILVVHWWGATDVKEYLASFRQLNLELKRLFDLEGIEFAFPTRTIHLKQDPQ